ncbi:MAG: hypothetical protein VYD19_08810 [Myxococcota bacterium]|nr:hypothetical protein [Myxococcota bacterium]
MQNHRRLLLLTLLSLTGIFYAALRSSTPDGELPVGSGESYDPATLRESVRRFLKQHHRFLIDPERIALVPLKDEMLSPGRPYLVFFSATPAEREGMRDLFLMRAQLGANGYRLSSTPPRNISDNQKSHDDLLLTGKTKVVYGQEEARGCRSVTYLGLSPNETPAPLFERLAEVQAFALDPPPERYTLRFREPSGACRARLTELGFEAFNGEEGYSVDLLKKAQAPLDAGAELIIHQPQTANFVDLLQKNLNAYGLITARESQSLTKFRLAFHDRFESFVYDLFVNRQDRRQFVPVGEVSSVALREPGAWLPPRIDVKSPRPGEGEWRAIPIAGMRERLIQETFVRLDPARPYLEVRLYAFDMKRLGLHLVGGGDPLLDSEGLGSARVPTPHRESIIAAFNGGPEDPRYGLVEDGHELRPLRQGKSTLLLDEAGRAAFGRWDLEERPEGWISGRPGAPPLFAVRYAGDGTTLPPQSERGLLDRSYQTRAALGVTSTGTLIYAWARSATAEQLSRALRLSGAQFAMSLRSGASQSGLALFAHRGEKVEGRPVSSQMKLTIDRWLRGSSRDFFYLVRSQSLPLKLAGRQESWGPKEGVWRPILHQAADPWIASTTLSAERCGHPVRLLIVDGRRLQPLLSPGAYFGPQHAGERAHQNDPVMLLPIGIPSKESGLMKLEEPIQPLKEGALSFAVDQQGRAYLGAWGVQPLTAARRWVDVIQGRPLLSAGQYLPPPKTSEGERDDAVEIQQPRGVHVGLGAGRRQRWLFATADGGGPKNIACALQLAGVREAMLLTDRGTAETGRARFFFKSQGPSYFHRLPDYSLESTRLGSPQSALLTIGSALLFTARATTPRAIVVESFRSLRP